MATRMQQRRATAEQWLLADPILAAGEIGYETDTFSFKIGDGINTWSILDYFENSTSLQGTIDDYIPLTQKGAALGVAELDASGFVPSSQLDIDLTAYYTSAEVDTEISTAVTGLASETFVNTAVSNLVDSAPATLDTLNELAAALGDDANFATTITNSLAGKSDTGHSHTVSDITDITATDAELNVLDGITATTTELNYTGGVTSNIQTQLDGKAASSHTHAISDVTSLQTELDSKAPLTPSVNAKTGAYTLTANDKGEVITASGTFTITVPGNVFAAGDRVDFVNIGTGVVTFAGSGLTLNSKDSAVTIDSQYAGATILFGSATVAYLIGAIA